ncbi:hypothetical protein [Haloferax sp. DFSO60]|uniref:DUF7511 domain-containing protein n=1 Tax=Haloferax sp. DFSO60 TaxID=3388652 RepID=UPI00397A4BBB
MSTSPVRPNDSAATNFDLLGPETVPADDVEYTAIIAPYDDAPDECTIFPAGLSENELLTTWLSAQEGSYVSLAEMA